MKRWLNFLHLIVAALCLVFAVWNVTIAFQSNETSFVWMNGAAALTCSVAVVCYVLKR